MWDHFMKKSGLMKEESCLLFYFFVVSESKLGSPFTKQGSSANPSITSHSVQTEESFKLSDLRSKLSRSKMPDKVHLMRQLQTTGGDSRIARYTVLEPGTTSSLSLKKAMATERCVTWMPGWRWLPRSLCFLISGPVELTFSLPIAGRLRSFFP